MKALLKAWKEYKRSLVIPIRLSSKGSSYTYRTGNATFSGFMDYLVEKESKRKVSKK